MLRQEPYGGCSMAEPKVDKFPYQVAGTEVVITRTTTPNPHFEEKEYALVFKGKNVGFIRDNIIE